MAIKKLIEVALPLEKINAESAREKSIRHGHPSTLHLWWARRPLAATRSVIWASLVDDPSSHPELFPSEEEQAKERERLFKILEQLVVWENSDNDAVLEMAKAEIMKSTNGDLPILLDPFSGGGAIPLEGSRLGLNSIAHDLNPVPVLLNKSMLEMPGRFANITPVNPEVRQSNLNGGWKGASGISEDIRYYGSKLRDVVFDKCRGLYPDVVVPGTKEKAPVIAWLWARTIRCPNPACKCNMPLYKSCVVAKNIAYFTVDKDQNGDPVFSVKNGIPSDDSGTVNRKGARCAFCGTAVGFQTIREEGKAGRMGAKLMTIIAKGKNGRIYLSPTTEHQLAAQCVRIPADWGQIANYPGYLNPPAYGLESFEQLFTDRQLFLLNEITRCLEEISRQVYLDAANAGLMRDSISFENGGRGAEAYSNIIKTYLSFVIDKIADYNSSICSWHTGGQKMRNTFGLTGMSMTWDYAEANPFSGASGSFDNMLDWVVRSVKTLPCTTGSKAEQFDAQTDCGLRGVMVSTDPPYYSNVPYADFADFFYVLLRNNLRQEFPDLFKTMQTPKNEELVADPYRLGGKENAAKYFENGMLEACRQMYLAARDDIPVTIYYAFKESDSRQAEQEDDISSTGWETMLTAIIQAGFSITGTWPMRTEMSSRTRGVNSNALASSIVLVCRKRAIDAPTTTRRSLIAELKRELRPALQKLQRSNIAPVDLAQSAIGPGMGVFSKYKKVLEADGTPMSVRSALQIINQELDIYFNEQDGELDRDSRFCVELYSQFAFNDMKFGDADTLARAKNTSVAALASAGVVYAQKGVVHLYGREEISEKVDHHEECIWLLTQQLTRAMETGGVKACAEIIAPMFGSNAEHAKDLAYRLYTIAERKGWSQEAYAYNSLVIAWPEVQSKAAELQKISPEQLTMF